MTLFGALGSQRKTRSRLTHKFRPSIGDRLEVRITPTSGLVAPFPMPSSTCDVSLPYVYTTSVYKVPFLDDGKVCFEVSNRSDKAITYTVAMYGFETFQYQTLIGTVTKTVQPGSKEVICAPAYACTQYDLVIGDGKNLPKNYDAVNDLPPGDSPFISIKGKDKGEVIPVLAAGVTTLDCDCTPDDGKAKGNRGFGQEKHGQDQDPPPPGFVKNDRPEGLNR